MIPETSLLDLLRTLPEEEICAPVLENLICRLGLNNEKPDEFPAHLTRFMGHGLHTWQYPNQLARFLDFLKDKGIASYLEIGVRHGGTFRLVTEFLKRYNPHLDAVGLDVYVSPYVQQNVPRFCCARADSPTAKQLYASQKWDMIFVDGDHRERFVRADWEAVKDHARYVVFHDIANSMCPGVRRVWGEIKAAHPDACTEFVEQYEEVTQRTHKTFLGIGIVDMSLVDMSVVAKKRTVALLTPTRNRKTAFNLLQRWIANQTRQPDQWIVVNDGKEAYDYKLNQDVILRAPVEGEGHSLCANIREGLKHVTADVVLIVEDDDYYAPTYIETMLSHLERADLVGNVPAVYYNMAYRGRRILANPQHASLAQTGFSRELFPLVEKIAQLGSPFIDRRLWRDYKGKKTLFDNERLHVSVKALMGEPGIGVGHRTIGTPDDETLRLLSAVMPNNGDVNVYRALLPLIPKQIKTDVQNCESCKQKRERLKQVQLKESKTNV